MHFSLSADLIKEQTRIGSGVIMRRITRILSSKSTLEGAGVKLKRVFGYDEVPLFDPFLLLDHFDRRTLRIMSEGFRGIHIEELKLSLTC